VATSAFNTLAGAVPISFSEYPIDLTREYFYEWEQRQSGSTMPPSPAVDFYELTYGPEALGWTYEAKVHWFPFVRELIPSLEPWQVSHRSRCIAMAVSAGRAFELHHRMEKMKGYKIKPLSDRESRECFEAMIHRTLQYMTFDETWIREYLKEHARSSFMPGHKWGELFSASTQELKALFQLVKTNLESLLRYEGMWNHVKFNTGLRARSEGITSIRELYRVSFTRTRIITFHPALSTWTLFIPQKAVWYRAVLEDIIKILHARPTFIFPYMEGGQTYIKASELFKDGREFKAVDGSAWDSVAGVILGKYFRGMMVFLGGYPMVASGISTTSMLDTIANVVLNRDVDGVIIALGDDMNYFGCRYIPRVAFAEYQPNDTAHGTILGVHFRPDPLVPRTSGFKVTSDRSTAMRPLVVDEDIHGPILEGYRRDMRQSILWASLLTGQVGEKGTLLEHISHMKGSEYMSTAIEDLTEGTLAYEQFELADWARNHGLKAEVFM